MYAQLMVPLDGSRFAETALPLATRLAQRAGSKLHIVMIAEPSGPTAAECEEYLGRIGERLGEDFTGEVTTSVRAGNIVVRLLEEAESCGADVTVMASHGRGGLSRMWLGSIATGFLHQTSQPLILVRPDPDDGEAPVHWGFAKLLVPLDGTELSERVLGHATEFGGMFGAAYHLVRVVSPPIDVGSPYVPPSVDVMSDVVKASTRAAETYLDEQAQQMRDTGLTVTTSVVVDPQPGRGILDACETNRCDSIAMATHARVGLSRAFLGSAADKVARGATVPVLLYRPETQAS